MTDFEKRFIQARRQVITREFAHLNDRQQAAVLSTEGPLLLLAGAGSGKTTVLIQRIANLLTYGRGSDENCTEIPAGMTADELEYLENYPAVPGEEDIFLARQLCAVEPAKPWEVIAITFTNKAAGELKERLSHMLGEQALDIWAATFHSACVRILRRDIERIGFSRDFTIYDTDDSKRVIKDICKELELDDKTFPPKEVMSIISNAKNDMLSPEAFLQRSEQRGDWRMTRIAKVFRRYNEKLRDANALDFDDLILHTVDLLQRDEEVRTYYQRKFRYVLIDEYQDTNHMQYLLASLLAGGHRNICVVGDDDQSIYRFRGANIENILNFENQYRGCRTIRLEQNYRSTQNILDAANAVIRHNQGRKGKTLWTQNGSGEKVTVRTVYNESDEANYIVGDIMANVDRGANWREHAILYRMNAQSNALEMAFRRNAVPYKVIGGAKFFDRAEIKDMLSYLCVINNPTDDLRLLRIINTPARGIGATTVETVRSLASQQGVTLFHILERAEEYPQLQRSKGKLQEFAAMIAALQQLAETMPLPEFYELVCEKTGYVAALEGKDDMESRGRLENIRELRSSIAEFLKSEPEDPTLSGFLNDIALYSDLDEQDDSNCVVMMTMHSAKGLEFPWVYVVGLEEGIFPSMRSSTEPEEMEEERRLCYVAMTRAKEKLTMTNARQRMIFGHTTVNLPSRFLKEIPAENMEWIGKPEPRRSLDEDMGSAFYDGMTQPRSGGYSVKNQLLRVEKKAAASGSAMPSDAPLLQISQGEMVEHKVFGRGMVLSVRPMGNDALLEVAFDQVGTKKLMLRSAGVHMKKI